MAVRFQIEYDRGTFNLLENRDGAWVSIATDSSRSKLEAKIQEIVKTERTVGTTYYDENGNRTRATTTSR